MVSLRFSYNLLNLLLKFGYGQPMSLFPVDYGLQTTCQGSSSNAQLDLTQIQSSVFRLQSLEWFPGIPEVVFRCGEAVSCWVFAAMRDLGIGLLISMLKRTVLAAFTCIFALGGAIVGTVVGAMKGQTTETGFLRGAGIGAVAGAITAVQLLESLADGESLSKVALLVSLVNGKVFIEWVSPAVLKAYQWQMNSLESTYREISDIYDVNGARGLSRCCIQKLPVHEFHSSEMIREESSCSNLLTSKNNDL
ncbi:NEP1-interacting protein 1-like [Durio zibethinus]|uniref:NEP1-interacting protein 1-like n=1 Tax=Durio zibethinus TaxID=66656 RepID=A0A6P5Y535_DURZI|nr:NEP1-interacting protein 1-like [Durio zibethinus]